MPNVSRRRWDVDGLGGDVVWMGWQALEDMVIIEGEFEVRWLVMGPEVVVGGAGNDSSMDVVEVDGWFR